MTRGMTPPKGRATPKRDQHRRVEAAEQARSARWSWILTGLFALIALAALIVVFGGGSGDPIQGVPLGGHGG